MCKRSLRTCSYHQLSELKQRLHFQIMCDEPLAEKTKPRPGALGILGECGLDAQGPQQGLFAYAHFVPSHPQICQIPNADESIPQGEQRQQVLQVIDAVLTFALANLYKFTALGNSVSCSPVSLATNHLGWLSISARCCSSSRSQKGID